MKAGFFGEKRMVYETGDTAADARRCSFGSEIE
jgi:hypothetical protein